MQALCTSRRDPRGGRDGPEEQLQGRRASGHDGHELGLGVTVREVAGRADQAERLVHAMENEQVSGHRQRASSRRRW
jgi:hypothetical protein